MEAPEKPPSAIPAQPESAKTDDNPAPKPREIGGTKGPDPTRYNDWERGGRCIDF